MSSEKLTPGADWETLGREVTAAAEAARREQRARGRVTPETWQRMREAMTMAEAALIVADIKDRAAGAAS